MSQLLLILILVLVVGVFVNKINKVNIFSKVSFPDSFYMDLKFVKIINTKVIAVMKDGTEELLFSGSFSSDANKYLNTFNISYSEWLNKNKVSGESAVKFS